MTSAPAPSEGLDAAVGSALASLGVERYGAAQ